MQVFEVNFDGLVGPTHHYAGLARGNLASSQNAYTVANPKAAALQGLKKMRFLYKLGIKQGFFPPQPRPNRQLLHQLGFTGSLQQQLTRAYHYNPQLLSACYSASGMWAANAATVSASQDCSDLKIHFTPANLISNFHRHQEAPFNYQLLTAIFNDKRYFAHHLPLPSAMLTSDEGAANHNRLAIRHKMKGINLFVYGKTALNQQANDLFKFPARQTLEASQTVARLHQLDPDNTLFVKQTVEAINQGVFHNDVIAVANESVLLLHEKAWENQPQVLKIINDKLQGNLIILQVADSEINLETAVKSYLFNSQLLTCPDGTMILISPVECLENKKVKTYLDALIQDTDNPINAVHYLDVKQSMNNGGGPACLRLRIPMSAQELAAVEPQFFINEARLARLEQWVETYYRDRLTLHDLCDVNLYNESLSALEALAKSLNLNSLYLFE